MNAPLLLDYCPLHLRADLWANDGFDPHNPEHVAEDPDRVLIMIAASEARERGVTRAESIACDILSACEDLDMGQLVMLEFIDDPAELRMAVNALQSLRREITKRLARLRAKRVLKRGGGRL